MSGIHLQSGKREVGLKVFIRGVRENPVTFAMVLLSVFLVVCFFSPMGPFFVRHHQLFGALAAIMIVPTGIFVWVMYMKYGEWDQCSVGRHAGQILMGSCSAEEAV